MISLQTEFRVLALSYSTTLELLLLFAQAISLVHMILVGSLVDTPTQLHDTSFGCVDILLSPISTPQAQLNANDTKFTSVKLKSLNGEMLCKEIN